ncbi:DNA primase [Parafannyhessea umbonata]|uniref:DNA primase n=1 Tax=Parafannyhessea umbonata TaxID=604330 RepID=A0A1H9QEF2_9ACTN|nr:DNA primase [Parafannyhessea umbonata]SER58183.1 DNA primase [Parafannyhessea umbonata]
MITDEDKERVRQASDILQIVGETVELRQRGNDFWGCCPFHHEKSPSFHVIPATGLWHCFGCGEGGDIFAYIMKRESLDFPDSIRYLADKAGIELQEERGGRRGPKRNRLIECMGEAEAFYSLQLLRGRGEGPDSGRSYLGGRGFGSDVCRRWGLGYAPGHGALVRHLREKGFSEQEMIACNAALDGRGGGARDRFFDRVIFPIHDELGRTIAMGGRVLTKGKPAVGGKYVNTSETAIFSKKKHLFAFDRAKDTMAATGTAIVCEGYTDVISMHEAGFTNTVATMGTALTMDHVKLLERFAKQRIICMFDGDAAGQKAAERAVQYIGSTSVELLCVVLPDNQDPMEFLSAHQPSELQEILDRARPLMDFVFEKRLDGYDLSVPGRRVAAMNDMAALLAPLKGSILIDGYASQLADLLGVEVQRVKQIVSETPVKSPEQRGTARAERRPEYDARSYDEVPAYDGPYGDPVPARPSGFGSMRGLTTDEKMIKASERELLSLIATHPDVLRPQSERIASFTWTDPRYESMAWAMLATPAGSSPQDVVAAASEVVPEAPRVLSSGRLESTSAMSTEDRASFLLDMIDLWSSRREIRRIKGKLKSASCSVNDAESVELFKKATELQKHVNELSNKVSSVV